MPRKCCAGIRASIRDKAWLQSRTLAHPGNALTPLTPAQRVQRDRAVALSRAVFSVLRTEARPARVHAGLLARFVNISMCQAQHTIAHTPALQALISAINAGKDRRLAFWAARCFIEEGRSPSAIEVLVRAGLPAKRVNRQFCIEAIACFTAGHSVCAGLGSHAHGTLAVAGHDPRRRDSGSRRKHLCRRGRGGSRSSQEFDAASRSAGSVDGAQGGTG